jgi:hypothetical protein
MSLSGCTASTGSPDDVELLYDLADKILG